MVVVAIIALLVALLLPALKSARRSADAAGCASRMRQASLGAAMYRSDFQDFVPVFVGQGRPLWYDRLIPYVNKVDVFYCPGSKFRTSVTMGPLFQGCYNFPTWKMGFFQNNWNDWDEYWPANEGKAWRDPNESVYVADAYITTPGVITGPPVYPSIEYYPSPSIHRVDWGAYQNGQDGRRFADRHHGSNCLFHDGRVERINTRKIDRMTTYASPDNIWDVY